MVSLFAISQSETFSSSLLIISITSAYECPSINTLVSSANKIENNKSDDLAKSLTLRKNKRGPNIDPCGTPCVMFLMLDLIPL